MSLETVWGWAEHHTLLEIIGIQNSTNTAQEKKSRCVLFPCSAGQTRARHGEFWGGTPCQPRDSETRRCGSLAALLGMPPARRAATILFLVTSGDAFVAPGSRGVGTQRCSRPVCLRGRCWPARCRLGPPTGSARTATARFWRITKGRCETGLTAVERRVRWQSPTSEWPTCAAR